MILLAGKNDFGKLNQGYRVWESLSRQTAQTNGSIQRQRFIEILYTSVSA